MIHITKGKSLEESEITISSGTIEFQAIKRGSRTLGYGLYLSQGSLEDPTEYFIHQDNIDEHIEALLRAKEMINENLVQKIDNQKKSSQDDSDQESGPSM